MSLFILNSEKDVTEARVQGNIVTFEVCGVSGDSVRFEATNFDEFPTNPVVLATFTFTATECTPLVMNFSWNKIRAIVVSGTPKYVVTANVEVELN